MRICHTDRTRWLQVFRAAARLPVYRVLLPFLFVTTLVSSSLSPRFVSARVAHTSTESAPTEAESTKHQSLEPHKWYDREISSGEVHYYKIPTLAGQYFSIEIEHWGLDLAGTISSPGNQGNTEFKCRRDEVTPVSVIVNTGGDHVLALRAAANGSKPGRYQVRLKGLRRKTESDHNELAVERILADADQLRGTQKNDSYRKAVEKYQEALASLRSFHDTELEANALKNLGKTYEALNENKRAVAYYHQALAISRRTKDLRTQSDVLNCLSFLDVSLGNNRQALSGADSALRLSRLIGSRSGEARALFTSGEAKYGLGDLQRALDYYQQALTLLRGLNDYRGQAQALLNVGYTYSSLSHAVKSRDAYLEAVSLSRVAQDRRWEAKSLRALASFQTRLGEYQQALDLFQQALQDLEVVDDDLTKATVLAGMGFTYQNLGELKKAFSYYNEAIAIFQQIKNPWGEAEAQMDSGRVSFLMGDGKESLARYQRALTLFRLLGMTRLQAQTLRDIGVVYDSWENRTQALNFYNQSLRLTRPGQDQRYEAYTLNYIGRALEASGEKTRAVDYYRRALRLNRVADDPAGEALTLYNLAHVQRDLNQLDECLAQIEAGLRISESLRGKVASQDVRASYVASTHQYFELHADILMQLHRRHPAEGFAVAAFEASEQARARSLLELLKEAKGDIREGVDIALLERERRVGQELNTQAERHADLIHSGKDDEAHTVARAIDQLTSDYEEIETQIRSKSPRYAALTQPQPLGLQVIQQQVLDDNTLLLEYMLGDERSYVWAVTRSEISSFELPARAQIENAARRFYKLLTANQPVPGETFEQRQSRVAEANAHISEEAAAFSKLVLGPVMTKLGNKRLLIVPDGALQYIPFQALMVPGKANGGDASAPSQTGAGSDEQIPLIVDHEIVNEPSASALALVISETARRKPAPKTIAVFANPVFEADDPRVKSKGAAETQVAKLSQQTEVKEAFRDAGFGEGLRIPPLPASREEANAIMAMAPWGTAFKAEGFEASRATITRPELGQYRIVHFATHGFVDYEHPELSGLVLSLVDEKGNPQDGFLRMHDIYNLKLRADLVVLSACNTALGKEVKGEGLIGLTRGFMYAGAAGVAASLWKVDDEATAELMKRFYEGMFKKGLTPAAALREAQLGMWRQKRWHAPYYWAAFVIQGQYNQKENTNLGPTRTVKWVAALASLAVAASLAVFLLLRRRRRTIL